MSRDVARRPPKCLLAWNDHGIGTVALLGADEGDPATSFSRVESWLGWEEAT